MVVVQSLSGVQPLETQLRDWTTNIWPTNNLGFPRGTSGTEPACQCRRHKRHGFDPWVRKTLWRRAWQPTPVFLPEEFQGQRSLAGYSPLQSWTWMKRLSMYACTQHNWSSIYSRFWVLEFHRSLEKTAALNYILSCFLFTLLLF